MVSLSHPNTRRLDSARLKLTHEFFQVVLHHAVKMQQLAVDVFVH